MCMLMEARRVVSERYTIKYMYDFLIKNFQLDAAKVKDKAGKYDESKVTIEPEKALYVFGDKGEKLPKNAIIGFENLKKLFQNFKD